jgi:2-octaprenyl-6-methoxyphenol hydroxylase
MSEMVDIAIVGGGMVGASLAVSLEGLGLRVAVIEAVPHDSASQPSFDERTTALSNGSRRILETLGLWSAVSGAATPIRKIHVSDQGRFGFARVDAAEQGLAAMGYVVPNRSLGTALWTRLSRSEGVRVFCPAQVMRVHATDRSVELVISTDVTIEARLVVAADGAQSARRLRSRRGSTRLRADGGDHDGAAAALPRLRRL